MTTTLNFGSNQRSSLEVFRISIQQPIPDQWDAVHKTYLDSRLTSLKAEILGADVSPLFDTLREIQLYLETNNLSGALLTQLSALTADLATERSERQSADNLISASVSSETARATAAESALSLRILDEQKAREASDNTLTASVSALATADNLLSVRVDDEKKARESEDLLLDAKISAEKTRAESVEASKFDKAGGMITGAVAVSGAVALNGNVSLNLSEATNTYLNLSPVWRVVCSNTGDRVQFEFFKDDQWTIALPFIMGA